jgi:FMN phosphatase YigB (HAD superfamily)
VGDKINRDILGSYRAGFKLTVKINHIFDDGEPDEGATPDAKIDNMLQLIPLLENELGKDKLFAKVEIARKIKAVFFDAGDILYYRPQKQLNFKNFLKGKIYNPDPQLEHKSKESRELAFQGKVDRYEYYRKTVELYGFTDEKRIQEGVDALDLDDNTVAIYEGVPETITSLKNQGYLLGIITDTALPYTVKLKWFEKEGFGHVWDVIVSSKDLGIRKPSPLLYEEALIQAGYRPHECAFVGHKATELEGAHNVGFKTIAFNYEKSAVADSYIEKFPELIDLLSGDFGQVKP